MKYLLLINNDRAALKSWRALSDEEVQRLREQTLPRWNGLFAWVTQEGIEVEGVELDDPQHARVVSVRDDERIVLDGPFAETKEQIGGYLLADCKDLDQAIALAERVPVASGSVEIRPLAELQ